MNNIAVGFGYFPSISELQNGVDDWYKIKDNIPNFKGFPGTNKIGVSFPASLGDTFPERLVTATKNAYPQVAALPENISKVGQTVSTAVKEVKDSLSFDRYIPYIGLGVIFLLIIGIFRRK